MTRSGGMAAAFRARGRKRSLMGTALGLTLVLAGGLSAGAALAQPDTTPPAPKTASPTTAVASAATGVAEVLVTARRREENLQEVPISETVVGETEMAERSIKDTNDLTAVVPGIHFHYSGTSSNPDVEARGASRLPLGDTPGAVAVYFAEVPLSNEGVFIPTYDLASIQALKGPQGTLFGRNSLSGAVLIGPREPTYNFGGYLQASGGNHDYGAIEGAVNIPLVDGKAALRLSGQFRSREGYVTRIAEAANPLFGSSAFAGDRANNLHRTSLRGSLLLQPTSSFKNLTIIDYFNADEAGSSPILYALGVPPVPALGVLLKGLFAQQQALGPYQNAATGLQSEKRELFGVTNRSELKVGPVEFRNIFGYRTSSVNDFSDTDATPLLFVHVADVTHQRQITEEFQALGKSFDDRLNWIGGVYYQDVRPDGLYGTLQNVFALAPWGEAYQTRVSKAIYAQADFKIVDQLTFTGGVRETWDTLSVCSLRAANTGVNSPPISADACPTYAGGGGLPPSSIINGKWSATTYTLSLNYQVTPTVLLYVTNRKGYREGGANTPLFNDPDTTNNPNPATGACPPSVILAAGLPPSACRDIRGLQVYRPEVNLDYEVGMKSDWALGDWRARFNIALYEDHLKDINNLVVVPTTGPTAILNFQDPGIPPFGAITFNDGEVRVRGIEAEVTIVPSSHLTIYGTVNYSDGVQLSNATIQIPGFPPTNNAVRSELDYGAGARVSFPVNADGSNLIYNIDWYHNDANSVAGGDIADFLPAYDLVNMRLTWTKVLRSPVDLSLFATNIFNTTYWLDTSQGASAFGFTTAHVGEPRMFGVDATYHFGVD